MKPKKPIGVINPNMLISKIRQPYHRPTKTQSNKKIEKRQQNKQKQQIQEYTGKIA